MRQTGFDQVVMLRRAEFKRLLLAQGLRKFVSSINHIEAAFDAAKDSDYGKLPAYQQEISGIEKILKSVYGEGLKN